MVSVSCALRALLVFKLRINDHGDQNDKPLENILEVRRNVEQRQQICQHADEQHADDGAADVADAARQAGR